MRDRERVVDREQRCEVADVLRPFERGVQVAEGRLRLTEIDRHRTKRLQDSDAEESISVARALERAEQRQEQITCALRVAGAARRGRELVIDRVGETVVAQWGHEALRDRQIAKRVALPLDEVERPRAREVQAAPLAGR